MVRIAVLIHDLFEDSEYKQPAEAFIQAGHELVHLGLKKGAVVRGKKQGTEVKIDEEISDKDDYAALLIPGGYSPDKLRAHEAPVRFVKDFVESGRLVFLICHAAQLLITADVLKGRTITGYRSIAQDIKNAGAHYEDKEVVIDGNLVSSRDPGDLPAFIDASLKKL